MIRTFGALAVENGEPVMGVRETSELHEAPGAGADGFHDLGRHSAVDSCHAFKVVGTHIVKCVKGQRRPAVKKKPVLGRADRNKTGTAREQAEAKLAQRTLAWEASKAERERILLVMKAITASDKIQRIADARYETIAGPAGMVRTGVYPFRKTGSLIIHDWHTWFSCGIGKFVLMPPVMTGPPYAAVCAISDCIAFLVSPTLRSDALGGFYYRVADAVWQFEEAFPPTEHFIMLHLLHEIYHTVKHLGPAFSIWMYPFERFLGQLSRKIHDRAAPERNLLTVHCTEVGLDFLANRHREKLFAGVPAACVPSSSHLAPPQPPGVRYTKKPRAGYFAKVSRSALGLLAAAMGPNGPELTPASVEVYTAGVHVPSADTGISALRGTVVGDQDRPKQRRTRTTNSVSFLRGGRGVLRVHFFCRVAADSHISYGERFALLQTEPGGCLYFNEADGVMTAVPCGEFAGVAGTGADTAPEAALGRVYVFNREGAVQVE
jgi:hypothetical protein